MNFQCFSLQLNYPPTICKKSEFCNSGLSTKSAQNMLQNRAKNAQFSSVENHEDVGVFPRKLCHFLRLNLSSIFLSCCSISRQPWLLFSYWQVKLSSLFSYYDARNGKTKPIDIIEIVKVQNFEVTFDANHFRFWWCQKWPWSQLWDSNCCSFEDIEIQNSSYAYYKHGAYMLQTIKP